MRGFVWVTVIVLTIIGTASVVGRLVFPAELTQRMEPVRLAVMQRFGRADPLYAERTEVLRRFEARYAAHPAIVYVHVIAGGLFLALAPLQLWASWRRRSPHVHRWIGRSLLVLAIPATITGFYLGVLVPIAGAGEATVIALVAMLFAFSLVRAFVAIRRGDVSTHRAWMIRACGVAFGVSVVRLAGVVIDFALTPRGIPITQLFVLALWSGWIITVLGAEWWIRRSQRVIVTLVDAVAGVPLSSTASTVSRAETPPNARSSGTSLRGAK